MAEHPFKGKTGLQRVINALGYSLDGIRACWKNEAAFRQVALLACIGIAAAAFVALPAWARAVVTASHLLTLIVELLNSAVEAAVDHTSLERHPLAKRAKDLGSAAQLICLINLALMWGLALTAKG
ncbi:diacylglycerol kinase [Chitiniphilus purpureus]|uniref:Diacylglycerol kinase n=1 Tax=Chitiniphilus purpureus TaxID=2981137 RepID=A0ABY6DMS9_9NEIS|nr:diacylglycerol kinase [Chitiniphilus sp. CD1]UXY15670.1 diacylglycerol kinase [Chitiniphilus sp. CD1]